MPNTYEQRRANLRNLMREWGGIYDDPLADIRKNIRVLYALLIVAIAFRIAEAVAALI